MRARRVLQGSCGASRNGLGENNERRIFGCWQTWTRTVLGDVMEVVAADDDGAGHLGRDDAAGEDAATDGDLTGKGALLVYTESSPFGAERIYGHENVPM